MRVYVHACVCMRVYMHACAYACVCVCMRVCMHGCVYAGVRICRREPRVSTPEGASPEGAQYAYAVCACDGATVQPHRRACHIHGAHVARRRVVLVSVCECVSRHTVVSTCVCKRVRVRTTRCVLTAGGVSVLRQSLFRSAVCSRCMRPSGLRWRVAWRWRLQVKGV